MKTKDLSVGISVVYFIGLLSLTGVAAADSRDTRAPAPKGEESTRSDKPARGTSWVPQAIIGGVVVVPVVPATGNDDDDDRAAIEPK